MWGAAACAWRIGEQRSWWRNSTQLLALRIWASFWCSNWHGTYLVPLSHRRGFPGGSDSKESACNAADPGSIPGSGRSPGEGHSNPLQYSCLENPMDKGVWQATVHGMERVGHNWATEQQHISMTPKSLSRADLSYKLQSHLYNFLMSIDFSTSCSTGP